jgi:hypothetical protein
MKALSCFSLVFMNWNDLVEWYNIIDNDMCIAIAQTFVVHLRMLFPTF